MSIQRKERKRIVKKIKNGKATSEEKILFQSKIKSKKSKEIIFEFLGRDQNF